MPQTPPAGYLAVPETGTGPAVLVLHAWWGLNAAVKNICTQLADAGYTVFAPDLYHGKTTETIAEAEALSSALDPAQAHDDVQQAVAFLRDKAVPARQSMAVIGFSLGAYFALELSVTDPEHFQKIIVFYGTRPGDYAPARAEYLGHFAENDPFEPQAEVHALEAALKNAGRPVTFHTYPATGHWFFEPDRPDAYNPNAAVLAWKRTLAFLKRTP